MNQKNFNIWDGVYKTWGEAPENDDVFNNEIWVSKIAKPKEQNQTTPGHAETFLSENISYDNVLPVVIAMARVGNIETLRVLDFGGGLGQGFFSLTNRLLHAEKIEFHVVETEAVCKQGKTIFNQETRLFFYTKLPQFSDPIHIVHSRSALQYSEDWVGLIKLFAGYKPKYLVLGCVWAGNIESFVTIQNYYGHKMRFHFLNLKELISKVEDLGFSLIYKSKYSEKIFDEHTILPMKNFDPRYRLDYPCQLIFEENI